MTKNNSRQLLCLILIVLTEVSCNKVEDFLRGNKEGDIRYCNIKKIQFENNGTQVIKLTYNSKGLPASAIYDKVITGSPNRYFSYDNKERLLTQLGSYDNGQYAFYAKYKHDSKGRIVSDTILGPGTLTPDNKPATIADTTTNIYTYDKYDRLIRQTRKLIRFPNISFVTDFDYNEDGNLVNIVNLGEVNSLNLVYDNNINPNRTNKIWMFINQDYSVNNSFTADSYNQNKLPLKISYGSRQSGPFSFFNADMGQSQFEYICK